MKTDIHPLPQCNISLQRAATSQLNFRKTHVTQAPQACSEGAAPLDGDNPKQHTGPYLLVSCVRGVCEVS